ncbi:hypothetical protein HK100_011639 [Physocladia obscura]|uniref:FAD-binding domain-containing protein n=1 Tax=Physocladia obscura TaxID=109957 RepID=A0AAD5XGH0_9FUNG|nr:hypothetical protein HK100_011639 [Physocladia obscura]
MKHLLISGAGISGLTLACLASRVGIQCTIVERNSLGKMGSGIGGGLGLWPASMAVIASISASAVQEVQARGSWMPNAGYYDREGRKLAGPSSRFSSRFPVLCLDRASLLDILQKYATIIEDGKASVAILENTTIGSLTTSSTGITVTLSTGEIITANLLVACDGIHSTLRPSSIKPKHLGYTYFRANVPLSSTSQWHSKSFESWGQSSTTHTQPLRFGFVPLKNPTGFWFLAVPTTPPSPIKPSGIHASIITESKKKVLLDMVSGWKGPDSDVELMKTLIETAPQILQTDIYKIPNVNAFSWHTYGGRVILLGDSAHATAPNIAQGAGLCIEDASVLVYLLEKLPKDWALVSDNDWKEMSQVYEKMRKTRARVVQGMADFIATVGQVGGVLGWTRNFVMRLSGRLMPRLQAWIFERVVGYSLGGDSKRWYWAPPATKHRGYCILEEVLGKEKVDMLAPHVKEFKTCAGIPRYGTGIVTVERSANWVGKVLGNLMGLPTAMKTETFKARVSALDPAHFTQKWTRVFGFGKPGLQKSYSTTHCVMRDGFLVERVGGILDRVVQLVYTIQIQDNGKRLVFNSCGIRLLQWYLPSRIISSDWVETATDSGWLFDGTISLFGIGKLMRYFGHFEVSPRSVLTQPKNHAIVSGGTGMIGTAVVNSLLLRGWAVTVLTRQSPIKVTHPNPNVEFLKWDAKTGNGWSTAIQSNSVLLNLAGSSVADSLWWTEKVKNQVLESRINAIHAMRDAVAQASARGISPKGFVQASAAGVAGDSGHLVVEDDFEFVHVDSVSRVSNFRPSTCKKIEEAAVESFFDLIPVSVVRIGHVLSHEGGLLPYLRFAAFAGVSKIGTGHQFVPWIHIDDAANGFCTVMENPNKFSGKINLVGPTVATNQQVLKSCRGLGLIRVPEAVFRGALGESSCVILDSERLVPSRLLQSGFHFDYKTVDEAINSF